MSAIPPLVVSGLPNMTPIFCRNWLVKIKQVLEVLTTPASLRKAWLMSRACRPTWLSPISPSISARGTKAATESTTTTSNAPERTNASAISNACSPVSGWLRYRVVDVHADASSIGRVQGMFDVDKAAHAAGPLGFGNDMQTERGLTGAFGAVDFDDTAFGHTAHAQGNVQAQAAGGDGFHVEPGGFSQLHHRTFAILLVEIGKGRVQRLLSTGVQFA